MSELIPNSVRYTRIARGSELPHDRATLVAAGVRLPFPVAPALTDAQQIAEAAHFEQLVDAAVTALQAKGGVPDRLVVAAHVARDRPDWAESAFERRFA